MVFFRGSVLFCAFLLAGCGPQGSAFHSESVSENQVEVSAQEKSATVMAAAAPIIGTTKSESSNLCMNISGGSTVADAAVIQYTCNTQVNEQMGFIKQEDGYYIIQDSHSKNCITPLSDGIVSGTKLVTSSGCNALDSSQEYFLNPVSAEVFRLVNRKRGLCVTSPSLSNAAQLTIAACNTTAAAQEFSVPAAVTASQVVLPLEVIGAANTTVNSQFYLTSVPSAGYTALYLRTHGLNYSTEGSVKINNGSWIALNNTTAQVQGKGARYGGIGGAFFTLKMNVAVPTHLLIAGLNTLSFRFNGTYGRNDGFRVLEYNVLNSSGSQVLTASNFVSDDPTQWSAPLNDASDIATGKNIWLTASLDDSPIKATTKMFAHCTDCHAQDGRDLKYFNYSNHAIQQRAIYHGLSSTQGLQIASYIRSLDVVNPGRPWNPPYQPGPTMDTVPIASWSAGAGIDAVLDTDAETAAYLPGKGTNLASFKNTATNGQTYNRLSVRTIPIDVPFLDWNHWLPVISPMDAMGSVAKFQATKAYADYVKIRTQLNSSAATTYAQEQFVNDANDWYGDRQALIGAVTTAAGGLRTLAGFQAGYAAAVLSATKMWEIMQDFNLEGIAPALYGSRAEARSWVGTNRFIFDVSPHAVGNAAGVNFTTMAVLGDAADTTCPDTSHNSQKNCTYLTENYLARIWYEQQLVLNGGQRQSLDAGFGTIDWGYMEGFANGVYNYTNQMEPMEEVRFMLKSMDEHDIGISNFEVGSGYAVGWNFRDNSPGDLLVNTTVIPGDWSTIPGGVNYLTLGYQAYLEKTARLGISHLQTAAPADYAGNNLPGSTYILGSGTNIFGDSPSDFVIRSVADQWNTQIGALKTRYNAPEALLDGAVQYAKALWPDNAWAFEDAGTGSGGAPSGVKAVSGVDQISLSWNAVSGATSYNVKRATVSNEPHFQTIAYFSSATAFTDYNLDPTQEYYYKVSANSASGSLHNQIESGDSSVQGARPLTGLVARYEMGTLTTGETIADEGSGSANAGTVYEELTGEKFVGVPQNLAHWLGNAMTVTAWIQVPVGFVGDGGRYSGPSIFGSAIGSDLFSIGAIGGHGNLGANFSSCEETGGPALYMFSPQAVNDDKQHFVAISRNPANGAVVIYIDGVVATSGVSATGTCENGRSFAIGKADGNQVPNDTYPSGSLEDVRIYNSVLSPATIESIKATGPQ